MKAQQYQLFYHLLRTVILVVLPIASIFSQLKITVTDINNTPLIGVYVTYNNTHITSDLTGIVLIDETLKKDTPIKFEYIGFTDKVLTFDQILKEGSIVKMMAQAQALEEIEIVGRTGSRPIDLPYKIKSISSEDIYNSSVQNSAEAIELSGGAYIQKSQMGGGSPILRGFEANKILLVVDGVRLNNAIYRNGHLQNAITIDPSILKQAEVIFGAGSLLYGSEALGGVIHYKTQSPLLNFDENQTFKSKITAFARYNSANQEKRFHINHRFSKRKWGVITSLTFTDYDDLRSGSNRSENYPAYGLRPNFVEVINGKDLIITNPNPNVQIGTAYSQYDILQKWVFQNNANLKTGLNLQYSSSSNIPRYDNLTEIRDGSLRYAEWYYGPQERLLISPNFTFSKSNKVFDRLKVIGSFQKISEDRVGRNLYDNIEENQNEDVSVYGLTIDFNKRVNHSQKLSYGADFHYNEVNSVAFTKVNPYSDSPEIFNNFLSRYPSGGSTLSNLGFYVQHNWQNQDSSIIWINGVRWTNQTVNFSYSRNDPFEWPDYFYDGIQSSNSAVVGITGLNVKKGRFLFKASTGTSFRSPNVDDLAKIRVNGDEITIPNPDLNSEKVWNSELNITYSIPKFSVGITGYYTRLSDAIIRETFTLPNGESEYITRTDTLVVTANVNANSGYIKGISAEFNWQMVPRLTLKSSINFQAGQSEDSEGNSSPLAHIPPTYGRTSLDYNINRYNFQFIWRFNAWKHIEDYGGSVDNPDFATVDGAPSWHNLGINTNFTMNEQLKFGLAIDNLLDLHYRPFASGLSAAGRHVVMSVKYVL